MKKNNDTFEKLFGKEPKEGYDITHTSVTCGWRAIVISWSAKGIGFGELAIVIDDKDGSIYADTECMNKEFCDEVVKKACETLDKDFPIEEDKIVDGEYIQQDRNGLLNSNFIKNLYKNVDWNRSV